MKKNIILLIVLILLYLGVGYGLKAYYGDSFTFLDGDHYWEPDGDGSWMKHGNPLLDMPKTKSVLPPLIAYYLPVFVPGFVLFLFLFTPLGKLLEEKKEVEQDVADLDSEDVEKEI